MLERLPESIDKLTEIISLLKNLSAILRDFHQASRLVGLLDPVRHLESISKRLEHVKRLLSRLMPDSDARKRLPLDKPFKLRG